MSSDQRSSPSHHLAQHVVDHIRKCIEDHALQPGDRLPSERELSAQLNVSRATLRSGIGYLAAMGVLRIRNGVGTFIADGPPEIGKSSLEMMKCLHSFEPWQMFEARNMLESSLAALAAERGQERDFATLAEEVAEMYAACESPSEYLIHDVRFHRTIARAAGNPILAAVMEGLASSLYEERRKTVEHTANLRESADFHRGIYRAIRSRDSELAAELMQQHLERAEDAQDREMMLMAPNDPGSSSNAIHQHPKTPDHRTA